jgi:hypothetical protein
MSEKEYPRNSPCPCGSGKKYKVCCAQKGIKYVTKRGEVSRVAPMSPELSDVFQEQRKAFVAKFGREPGPGDPILFDPNADTPQPINEEMVRREMNEAMKAAGIRDELIYAYNKTGYVVTSENQHLIPEDGARAFQEAVDEFKRMFGDRDTYDHNRLPLRGGTRRRGPSK